MLHNRQQQEYQNPEQEDEEYNFDEENNNNSNNAQQQQQTVTIHPATPPASRSTSNSNQNNNRQNHNQQQQPKSHQQFLYENGKSPLAEIHYQQQNNRFNNETARQNSSFQQQQRQNSSYSSYYPQPEPLPFTPVPIAQALQTHEATTTISAFSSNQQPFLDINNGNAANGASRHMYTAAITKLRTQLSESQRSLHAKTVECDTIRNEMTQRDREASTRFHTEVKTRVDSEVASLNREHNRQHEAMRNHYENMVEQLHGRVKASENEAEEMRLRVSSMTTKMTEATSAAQRDRQNLESAQKRFESEIVSLRERHQHEIEHMKKETDVTRSSVDGRDQVSFSQVASLQSDVRRLQSELENSRNHAARLQSERDDDIRRNREDREVLQRESEAAVRRMTERAKLAEANEREALDRALKAERQSAEERGRRERLGQELAGIEAKEHETMRVLARRDADVARLEARIETLQIKANTFATEAAAVRREFEVRDSREQADERMNFEKRLTSFRERGTEAKNNNNNNNNSMMMIAAAAANNNNDQDHNNSQQQNYPMTGGMNQTPFRGNSSSFHSNNNNNNNQQPRNLFSANNYSSSGSINQTHPTHQSALQEVLEATVSEMNDLKRSLALIPQHDYSRRGGPGLETRISTLTDEINRLNDRVARTESAQYKTSSTNFSVQQNQRPPVVPPQSLRHTPASVDFSPAMKKVRELRDALDH